MMAEVADNRSLQVPMLSMKNIRLRGAEGAKGTTSVLIEWMMDARPFYRWMSTPSEAVITGYGKLTV